MSRWAVRHPVQALIAWAVLLIVIGLSASRFAGTFNDSFALPGASSTTAQDLLTKLAGPPTDTSSIKVVWSSPDRSVTADATKRAIDPTLKELAGLPFTSCVVGPYGRNLGSDCPPATPVDLRAAVKAAARAELAKATGIPEDRLGGAVDALDSLAPLEKADPKALAAIGRALPEVARLASAPRPVLDALAAITPADLSFVVGLTPGDVTVALDAIGGLDVLVNLPAADLTAIAKEWPAIAPLTEASKPTLDALAKLTPSDLSFLVGITRAQVDAVTTAFGDLDRFAQLPPAALKALADADPRELAELAATLPADVTAATRTVTDVQDEVRRIAKAAAATQKVTTAVSSDDRVAYATVTFDRSTLTARQADRVLDILEGAGTADLTVGGAGSILDSAGTGPDTSQGIGLIVAIVILLIAFGSLVAAGLPIVVAMTGLVAGQLLIVVVARFTDVASFAPTLAAMIGLGVGIDYALFIMNRFTQGVRSGATPKDAALTAVGTAGKAVAFAGSTVIIALLGMFVLGIGFFNGLALAAATAVLMVMLSALWMLPALLSLLGTRALALRMPWARHPRPFDPAASRWNAYGRLLQRAPVVPVIIALAAIGVLALPATKMTLGFPDDSSAAQGSPQRVGFDLLAKGFGDGVNGPFFVAVEVPKKDDYEALEKAIVALERTPGVAQTIPSSGMMPILRLDKAVFGDGGRVTSIIVQPSSSPSAAETSALLDRIRTTTAAQLLDEAATRIYVGGTQAVSEDFTAKLQAALPLFLLLVVGLGFLALTLLFHSLLIPLTAAVTSLLSFAAALGVTVSVFQLGVADSLLGVTGTGPILPFLPIMVFAILFGLSMDYQVFLVSRMREEWERSSDNASAVRLGLAGSGRVVVVAATIMTSVFLSFVPTPVDTIKLFGVALASAVIIDAFIVRLVLVPSLMSLFGRANWWMPRWLGRVLPTIRLE
jgi:RND superfamily putative drug exporter